MNMKPGIITSSSNLGCGPSDLSLPSLLTSPSYEASATSNPRKILYPMPRDSNQAVGSSWMGLAPLDMVQKIVSMAESSATSATSSSGSDGKLWLQTFLGAHRTEQHAGEKRKRGCSIEDDLGVGEVAIDDRQAEALVASARGTTLAEDEATEWKPSDTVGDSPQVAILDSLAKDFEAMTAGKELCLPSYHRVQQAFLFKVVNGDPLAAVVDDATKQMRILLEIVNEKPKAAGNSRAPSRPPLRKETSPFGKDIIFNGAPSEGQDAFQFYMQHWLSANWAHPFPDSDMLEQLALFLMKEGCITLTKQEHAQLQGLGPAQYREVLAEMSETKINNWLVNSRTRRWRKSLSMAFDQKRPATMLYEDSLRIFEGKDLRPLANWDGQRYFAFDGKYSVPLASWKQRGLLGNKAKGPKSRKRSFGSVEASAPALLDQMADRAPALLNQMAEAPFDLSPCWAFERAGGAQMLLDEQVGGAQMLLDANDMMTGISAGLGGSHAAI